MGKNTIIKDAIALLVITLVSGLCLGFVFSITETPIAQAKEKAKKDAYAKVFEAADHFEAVDGMDASLETYNATADGAEVTEVLQAVDASGAALGYVVSMTAKEGYGGDISLSMGIDSTGTITGFEVLSMSETAGLGAKCTQDEFKSQFAGKQETVMVLNENFDQISSATITSKAITKALNASLGFVQTLQ